MNMHPLSGIQFSCCVDMCIKIQGVCVQLEWRMMLVTGMYNVVYHRPVTSCCKQSLVDMMILHHVLLSPYAETHSSQPPPVVEQFCSHQLDVWQGRL